VVAIQKHSKKYYGNAFLCVCAGFPTNKTELNAVFDIFDREKRGLIDYADFVDALKPDKVQVDFLCAETIK
jgi:Ca2+-binding EF-hand superfamily protein